MTTILWANYVYWEAIGIILHPNFLNKEILLDPLTPMCDQDRIPPYNINTISSRQLMRMNKNIN